MALSSTRLPGWLTLPSGYDLSESPHGCLPASANTNWLRCTNTDITLATTDRFYTRCAQHKHSSASACTHSTNPDPTLRSRATTSLCNGPNASHALLQHVRR
eukprot:6174019-Pleurochrysis_carterae.AAC.1